jgi:glycosyltransferase involved in cell wall biosynthesis
MKKTIVALYATATGFSGQLFAVETVVKGLSERGWNVLSVKVPSVDRSTDTRNGILQNSLDILRVISPLVIAWIKIVFMARDRILYVCLGQTTFSLLREGLAVVLSASIKKFSGVVISLHGSDFMSWQQGELKTKIFLKIAQKAHFISILGRNQYAKMIQLGVAPEKVFIMDNTSLLSVISNDDLVDKHTKSWPENQINVLFLSSLIESKGYIQFVESIAYLAKYSKYPLSATLCGKTIFHNQSSRFSSLDEVRAWLEKKMIEINDSPNVKIQWIEGAVGEEKQNLFRQSHIFVLPTQYKTEAQPIVLLEALASGCVIVTTTVGEITSTVDENTAFFLSDCLPESIGISIENLCLDSKTRIEMAVKGVQLFEQRFEFKHHIDRWENIFASSFER